LLTIVLMATNTETCRMVSSMVVASYALLIEVGSFMTIPRRNGSWVLERGYYTYVGSANIGRPYLRVLRHLMKDKKVRWHVDVLTSSPVVSSILAVLAYGVSEELLYLALASQALFVPVARGFGASDSKNHITHLFKVDVSDPLEAAKVLLGLVLRVCPQQVEIVVGAVPSLRPSSTLPKQISL
jgi:Uri superfamily endonuclease